MNPPRAVEENRSALDRELDETLEASFPASDAAANTVVTGCPSPCTDRSRWRRARRCHYGLFEFARYASFLHPGRA